MATSNKIPTLGFAATIAGVVLLGFGSGSIAPTQDAYLDDFIIVGAVGRMLDVPEQGRFLVVPAIGRDTGVAR